MQFKLLAISLIIFNGIVQFSFAKYGFFFWKQILAILFIILFLTRSFGKYEIYKLLLLFYSCIFLLFINHYNTGDLIYVVKMLLAYGIFYLSYLEFSKTNKFHKFYPFIMVIILAFSYYFDLYYEYSRFYYNIEGDYKQSGFLASVTHLLSFNVVVILLSYIYHTKKIHTLFIFSILLLTLLMHSRQSFVLIVLFIAILHLNLKFKKFIIFSFSSIIILIMLLPIIDFSFVSSSDPGNISRIYYWSEFFIKLLPMNMLYGVGFGNIYSLGYETSHFESSIIGFYVQSGYYGLLFVFVNIILYYMLLNNFWVFLLSTPLIFQFVISPSFLSYNTAIAFALIYSSKDVLLAVRKQKIN